MHSKYRRTFSYLKLSIKKIETNTISDDLNLFAMRFYKSRLLTYFNFFRFASRKVAQWADMGPATGNRGGPGGHGWAPFPVSHDTSII